ncbi:sugar phosphate nucleotidyltransferase [Paenibacillus wynnii]|uniref:sugar phosphate nucleotidyltransferase n=1 Tax=Paenibacillus wynnii TaxID=268407 RepID=UPI0027942293|nr:sugar phosphate nucleotidyltransferase [Paenibacillus wynnii]MDQ0195061.1 mannose-1-phosphate guanylyltransferase [Paenibacillus wynnii]
MHTLLLCGGSGQRLWPLSNPIRSKMFLELLPAPDGGLESMIGRVCRQLSGQGLGESALFITHQDQTGLTKRYTKDCYPVIGEPWKRGTFTAAALGSLHLHSTGKAKLNDTICVAPADMFADDNFFGHFHTFPEVLKASQADIVLLGTRPTYPSDQYGYILPGDAASMEYTSVNRFEEKPDSARAKLLIQQNALWNCGVFAFSLQFMLSYLKQIGLPVDFDEFVALYPHLPIRSFDKEVVERTGKLAVIRHEGDWRDLGSWDTLTEQLRDPIVGKGGTLGETINTHIINELDVPLYVIGVSNIVAIASPDGVLIANKVQANGIKEIIGSHSMTPVYGETQWGSYCILDTTDNDEDIIVTLKLTILPNHKTQELCSKYSNKIWTVVAGSGELILDGLVHPARVGDIFTVAKGVIHEIRAFTAMEWIEVRMGNGSINEAIYSG